MAKNKKQFEVLENESIDDCLNRIQEEGYMPVRRMEKPIFQEKEKDQYVPVAQKIIFEAIKTN